MHDNKQNTVYTNVQKQSFNYIHAIIVQIIQFIQIQGIPSRVLSSILNIWLFSAASITVFTEFYNLAPSHARYFLPCVMVVYLGSFIIEMSR